MHYKNIKIKESFKWFLFICFISNIAFFLKPPKGLASIFNVDIQAVETFYLVAAIGAVIAIAFIEYDGGRK